jgi:hypothetical protein
MSLGAFAFRIFSAFPFVLAACWYHLRGKTMGYVKTSRIVGGVLVLSIGAVVALASAALWRGRPDGMPFFIASNAVAIGISRWMAGVALLLAIAGAASIGRMRWGFAAAVVSLVVFVGGAAWANQILFGGIRPVHAVTNVVVAIVAMLLLKRGYDAKKIS